MRRSDKAARVSRFTGVLLAAATALVVLAPATTANAGDGYDVFFDRQGHVFNIFHHNNAGDNPAIDCHTRSGQSCGSNWPYYFNTPTATPFWNTIFRPTGWVDDDNGRIWFQTYTSTGTGFACLDIKSGINSPTYCFGSKDAAFKQLGDNPNSPSNTYYNFDGVNEMVHVGSKLYALESASGRLLCMDAAEADASSTGACAGQPYTVVTLTSLYAGNTSEVYCGWSGQTLVSGGKVFALVGNDVYPSATWGVCWDPATDAACSEAWPIALTAPRNKIYQLPDATGAVRGVCFTNTQTGDSPASECFDQSGASLSDTSSLKTALTNTLLPWTGFRAAGWTNLPQVSGTRVYWVAGTWNNPNTEFNIHCFDIATNQACATSSTPGWPFAWPVTNGLKAKGSGYAQQVGGINWGSDDIGYATAAYAVKLDPRPGGNLCLWKNGDNTLIAAFDAITGVPYGWFLGALATNVPVNICMDDAQPSGSFTTTSTVVTSSVNPSQPNAEVTFTATVTGVQTKDSNGNVVTPTDQPVGPADGGVSFWIVPSEGAPFEACPAQSFSATAPGNVVTCTFTFTQEGTYSVLAIYGGSVNFGPSNNTVNQVVTSTPATPAQLTDTRATCSSVFLQQGYPSLGSIAYSTKSGVVSQVNPGVFFYWAKVVLTSGGTLVTQSESPNWARYFTQAAGSQLYDASCRTVKGAVVSTSGAVTSVSGAAPGTYYLGLKLATGSLVGVTPSGTPMTATFTSGKGATTVSLQVVSKK